MSSEPPGEGTPDAYRALAEAGAAERSRLLLDLIAAHPGGRLELPARGGARATLDDVSLGRDRLREEHAGKEHPSWWNAERQALQLRHADLRGASLRHANLTGASLEEANLAGADFANAHLGGVTLAGSDLTEALFEDTDLRKASLRFVVAAGVVLEGANLQGADLWGARLEGAVLSRADLQGATLEEADLRGADLQGADLRGAVLKRADLRGANLHGADLRGASLGATNFEGAFLREANLQGVGLTGCSLTHAHTADAWLERTRLHRRQFGGVIGEELAGDHALARKGYLALEGNFDGIGDHDGARWAYLRRRRMEKWGLFDQARSAWVARKRVRALRMFAKFLGNEAVEWLCDYGESVPRVLAALFAVYVLFILLYGVTGSVVRVSGTGAAEVRTTTRDPVDLAIFSLSYMTTSGNPSVALFPRHEYVHLLTGVQAGLGIALTGLLGFVAGNRIRR